MRRYVYLLLIIGFGIMLTLFFKPKTNQEETHSLKLPAPQELEISSLLAYTTSIAPTASVQTQRDVFPGGLMAAMAPGIIDWKRSQPENGQGFAIMRNVNDGGNPLSGFTTLRTVQIPLGSLKSAEFVLVPLGPGGKRSMVSHGQIRFTFDPAKPVLALNSGGQPDPNIPPILDLVFSWEAWRHPGEDYNVMVGMDSGAYALSLRVFSGRQRYLEDILGQRDWFCTPLTLPGGQAGLLELFRVCAVMGDGYGRSSLGKIYGDAKDAWVQGGGPLQSNSEELLVEWNKLQKNMTSGPHTEDIKMNPVQATESYQTLIRSCATMALYTINVATERLQKNQTIGANEVHIVPLPAIDDVPEWMRELSDVDLTGLFLRAPHVLGYIRENKAVIPKNIPDMLAKAGLGATENGKVLQIQYGREHLSPYVHSSPQP